MCSKENKVINLTVECTGCGDELPATTEYFHVKSSKCSGLNSECKVCVSKRTKKYRRNNKELLTRKKKYYSDNKKEIAVKVKRRREVNPEKESDRKKKWYNKNKKKVRIKHKKYYQNNKDRLSITYSLWRKNNKDKCKAYAKNHKVLKRTNGTGVDAEQWEEILIKYNYRCAYCSISDIETKQGYLTQDHVIPLNKNGEHSPENVVPTCVSCNCKKGDKLN